MQILIGIIVLIVSAQANAGDLDWIEGHWRSEGESRVSEEIWTDGEGGLYLGVNRSIRNGEASGFEFLRIIHTSDRTAYCAQPGGAEAVCFDAVSIEENRAVFENPDHDFPQQIVYEREGDALTATISDLSSEQSFSFGWTLIED